MCSSRYYSAFARLMACGAMEQDEFTPDRPKL